MVRSCGIYKKILGGKSMNKVFLIGNLTKDPEMRSTQSGVAVCNFSIAVNRRFKNANGEQETDFLNVIAWRQLAELCGKYLAKGRKVAVTGSIQTEPTRRRTEASGQRGISSPTRWSSCRRRISGAAHRARRGHTRRRRAKTAGRPMRRNHTTILAGSRRWTTKNCRFDGGKEHAERIAR